MSHLRTHAAHHSFRSGIARTALALCALLVVGQLGIAPPAGAEPAARRAPTTTVDLGSAAPFSILGGTGVVNTGAGTVVGGDLGLSASGAITGFGPGQGVVQGTIHDKDADGSFSGSRPVDGLQRDQEPPRRDGCSGRPDRGKTLAPGLYNSGGAFLNTGTFTLNGGGDPNAVFVFQIPAAFSPAASSALALTNGTKATNVFWQVDGAVSIGAGSSYAGTFLVNGAITLGNGVVLDGRALGNGGSPWRATPCRGRRSQTRPHPS